MQTEIRPMQYLVMSGSGRAESFNRRLTDVAARAVHDHGGDFDTALITDFPVPVYDGDLEADGGVPDGAASFKERLDVADGLVLVSPEYNASVPGSVKNLVDWVSRIRPQPFHEKHVLLMSASPSMAGGNRGLWALRVPLEHLGARVYPDMFSLAQAHAAFTPDGALADVPLARRLADNVAGFMDLVEAAVHYPCAKHAWVEFLGERPDPAIDRVETA
ncbi:MULTISPECIES: NADPH-dependent FMN reductase [Glycomyces]|uniref:NAD(P)H-dependent FMN reductase n=2 Tax=Glycomyces TaxID=58113 RepID=A0ABU2ATH7_9ACTN|nr:NADPH-dependent FMN reductase [Glycomyces lechevalierae]MDR7340514.1 NAD(P)H-dependent FMN reductase [Glycomyces lechevalierae]